MKDVNLVDKIEAPQQLMDDDEQAEQAVQYNEDFQLEIPEKTEENEAGVTGAEVAELPFLLLGSETETELAPKNFVSEGKRVEEPEHPKVNLESKVVVDSSAVAIESTLVDHSINQTVSAIVENLNDETKYSSTNTYHSPEDVVFRVDVGERVEQLAINCPLEKEATTCITNDDQESMSGNIGVTNEEMTIEQALQIMMGESDSEIEFCTNANSTNETLKSKLVGDISHGEEITTCMGTECNDLHLILSSEVDCKSDTSMPPQQETSLLLQTPDGQLPSNDELLCSSRTRASTLNDTTVGKQLMKDGSDMDVSQNCAKTDNIESFVEDTISKLNVNSPSLENQSGKKKPQSKKQLISKKKGKRIEKVPACTNVSPNKDIPFAVGLLPLKAALEKFQAMPDYQPRKTRSSSMKDLASDAPVTPAPRLKRKSTSLDVPVIGKNSKKNSEPQLMINNENESDKVEGKDGIV